LAVYIIVISETENVPRFQNLSALQLTIFPLRSNIILIHAACRHLKLHLSYFYSAQPARHNRETSVRIAGQRPQRDSILTLKCSCACVRCY